MNVIQSFHSWAQRTPAALAIIEPARTTTYGALERAALHAAASFLAAGCGPGMRIAIAMRGSVSLQVVVMLALARIGAVQVALGTRIAPRSNDALLQRLRIGHIVTDYSGFMPEATLLRPDEDWLDPATMPPTAVPLFTDESAPWSIVVSSGSTGAPKAATVTHAMEMKRSESQPDMVSPAAGERMLCLIPMDARSGRSTALRAMQRGAAFVSPAGLATPAEILAFADRWSASVIIATPSQISDLVAELPDTGPRLPGVRALRTNSGGMPLELLERTRRRLTPQVYVDYGTSDGGTIAIATPGELAGHPDTCGRVVAGVELELIDHEGRHVPRGVRGEVRMRSGGVVLGYIEDDEASRRMFRDGWFHPGDIAEMNEEGLLFVRGRTDSVMNFGGIKVSTQEIERVLRGHPSIAEVVAFALPSPRTEVVPAAAIVLREGADGDSILRYCRRELGARRPRYLLRLDSMPRDAMGKIVQQRLIDMVAERRGKA